MTGSMTPEDRGTLGALLDGELSGDARRFALRRLSHDTAWQQAAARWQLAGDVLRGEPVLPAPAGFASRVAAAVAAEQVATATTPPRIPSMPAPASGRRHARWIGGAALAASVAMIALFAVRPPLQPGPDAELADASEMRLGPAPANAPAERAAVDPDPALAATSPAGASADPAGGVPALAAAAPLAVAAVDAGRREATRSRGQQQRAALRASQARNTPSAPARVAIAAAIDPAPTAERDIRVAGAGEPAPALQEPFAPTDTIASRPWPRALPALSGRSAFTASFGAGSQTAAPTFYPFEPHLPPELQEQLGVALPPAMEPAGQH